MSKAFVAMLIESKVLSALVWFPEEICLESAKELIDMDDTKVHILNRATYTLDLGVSNWVFGTEEDWSAWEAADL